MNQILLSLKIGLFPQFIKFIGFIPLTYNNLAFLLQNTGQSFCSLKVDHSKVFQGTTQLLWTNISTKLIEQCLFVLWIKKNWIQLYFASKRLITLRFITIEFYWSSGYQILIGLANKRFAHANETSELFFFLSVCQMGSFLQRLRFILYRSSFLIDKFLGRIFVPIIFLDLVTLLYWARCVKTFVVKCWTLFGKCTVVLIAPSLSLFTPYGTWHFSTDRAFISVKLHNFKCFIKINTTFFQKTLLSKIIQFSTNISF